MTETQTTIPATCSPSKAKRFPSIWNDAEIDIPKYHELMFVFGRILRSGASIEQGQA